jgi:hypothetical protein
LTAILEDPIYVKSRQDRVRLILVAIENNMRASSGNKTEEPLANTALSIEHLLPQEGDVKDYPYAQGENYKRQNESSEQARERLSHTPGNLTLLTQPLNSSISNGAFLEKRAEIVEHTVLRLNKFLGGEGAPTGWNEHLILSRGQLLFEYVRVIWPIPPRSTEDAPKAVRDNKLIAAKRKAIMDAINKQHDFVLGNKSGALFETYEGKVRAICAISKRHEPPRSPYWYQYSPQWRDFLADAAASFFVLGCMDSEIAYAIPSAVMEKILDSLYLTPQRHWHVVLEQDNAGQMALVTRNDLQIPLKPFAVNVGVQG